MTSVNIARNKWNSGAYRKGVWYNNIRKLDEGETDQMKKRWTVIRFKYRFQPHEVNYDITPCGSCFAKLLLDPWCNFRLTNQCRSRCKQTIYLENGVLRKQIFFCNYRVENSFVTIVLTNLIFESLVFTQKWKLCFVYHTLKKIISHYQRYTVYIVQRKEKF